MKEVAWILVSSILAQAAMVARAEAGNRDAEEEGPDREATVEPDVLLVDLRLDRMAPEGGWGAGVAWIRRVRHRHDLLAGASSYALAGVAWKYGRLGTVIRANDRLVVSGNLDVGVASAQAEGGLFLNVRGGVDYQLVPGRLGLSFEGLHVRALQQSDHLLKSGFWVAPTPRVMAQFAYYRSPVVPDSPGYLSFRADYLANRWRVFSGVANGYVAQDLVQVAAFGRRGARTVYAGLGLSLGRSELTGSVSEFNLGPVSQTRVELVWRAPLPRRAR